MVDDLCAIVDALKMKGVPQRLTIEELCGMNGRSALQIRSMIIRMGTAGELTLLRRLQNAFLSVNLNPKYLAEAITELSGGVKTQMETPKFDSEPLQLARSIPVSPVSQGSAAVNIKPMVEHGTFGVKPDSVEDAQSIIRILEKHDPRTQRKMMSMVLAWAEPSI